jgi:hypothetical protein
MGSTCSSKVQETQNDLMIVSSILQATDSLYTNLLQFEIDMQITISTINKITSKDQIGLIDLFRKDIANINIENVSELSVTICDFICDLQARMSGVDFLSSLKTDLKVVEIQPLLDFINLVPKGDLLNTQFNEQCQQALMDVYRIFLFFWVAF